jgi:hypothetical protein
MIAHIFCAYFLYNFLIQSFALAKPVVQPLPRKVRRYFCVLRESLHDIMMHRQAGCTSRMESAEETIPERNALARTAIVRTFSTLFLHSVCARLQHFGRSDLSGLPRKPETLFS